MGRRRQLPLLRSAAYSSKVQQLIAPSGTVADHIRPPDLVWDRTGPHCRQFTPERSPAGFLFQTPASSLPRVLELAGRQCPQRRLYFHVKWRDMTPIRQVIVKYIDHCYALLP
jgi:hypothetical protein